MSTANESLQAADPARNASVHASAGTGKTWLLVTRILRLLLGGAAPDSILAITFTRKAAAEMQQRVTERLRELMTAAPQQLDGLLVQCGVSPDAATRLRARQLYEALLFDPYTLRATTFHAFCQELLQRFPLEAGVSPGFDLIESGGLLEQAARDALVSRSAREPGGAVSRALDTLVEGCDGLSNVQSALGSFLAHRSDWWAWTQDHPRPFAFAQEQLEGLLGVTPRDDPLAGFPAAPLRARLKDFADLLGRNTTKTNTGHAGTIHDALANTLAAGAFLDRVISVFFKNDGEPRERTHSQAQRKRLGEQDEVRFLDLHRQLVDDLRTVLDRQARVRTLHTNLAWYTAGMELLEHYQRIKQEQRLLDFADLEWEACRLLNRSDHASWVQYKLDARIDHLLVDEFQDTNPTQWRLLLPLLEELAAGDSERSRSVFLVGDRKQSIYGFRRANPALLDEASDWLEHRLQAGKYPLDASRRSAQAIIDCVNAVFGTEPLQQRITAFNPHTTWNTDLYGRVEVLPLATSAGEPETVQPAHEGLRNPLQTPRLAGEEPVYLHEGRLIASRIAALIDAGARVVKNKESCALDYGDIIILLRQRTHAASYERALREAGIPYASAGRGELLDNLEVRDLEALLIVLISPYADLELAQVLRSPLFGLSSEQLLPLARGDHRTWYERLAGLAQAAEPVYQQAYAMLEGWRALTGTLPVHDLLDRIYHEAGVMQRFAAAFPPALAGRVQASLTRFIELALELDNGRYPSLPYFLDRLARLRQSTGDQPEEGAPDDSAGRRVRLLTIHGAKGLEAPVIFLADAAASGNSRHANEALVRWPPGKPAPDHLLLTGKKALLDPVSQDLLEDQQRDALREDANLLYVALTRARQYLFISGSEGKKSNDTGWYGMIADALSGWKKNPEGNLCHETGVQPAAQQATGANLRITECDPRLSGAIPPRLPDLLEIAPSRAGGNGHRHTGDAEGRERGIAIHAMLEWLANANDRHIDALPASLVNRLGRAADNPELQSWWLEALRAWRNPDLAHLFDPVQYRQALNEVPVQFLDDGRLVYGIIDRVVIGDDAVTVIDYKTHRAVPDKRLPELTDDYRAQMRLYARAAALIWPERTIRTCLLFTSTGTLITLEETD